jgi:poly(A) polymerase
MKVSGAWLDMAGTQALMAALLSAGHQAFFVGGCVRNAIIGAAVGDIDIATDAHPELVTKIAKDAGYRVVPTGIDHGTVTVIAGGVTHEVTTLRRDVRTDGRHAVVAYSSSVAEDAARRDFTMNALYATADGTALDPLGGLPDLLARRVRFVGDADARIAEDYLRILRFFRFYAIYGDPALGIDVDGLAACAVNAAGLETLSRERVGAEMRKLLGAQDPAPALAAMDHSGILTRLLPGASVRAVPILVHLEDGAPCGWLCRLVVLGGDDVTHRLRLSRTEAATLAVMRAELGSVAAPDALGWKHGTALAGEILHGRAALFETKLPSNWQNDVARGANAIFPVTAFDLMPDLQGAALGSKLKTLQDLWLSSGLSLTREQLLTQ